MGKDKRKDKRLSKKELKDISVARRLKYAESLISQSGDDDIRDDYPTDLGWFIKIEENDGIKRKF